MSLLEELQVMLPRWSPDAQLLDNRVAWFENTLIARGARRDDGA